MTRPRCALTSREGGWLLRCTLTAGHGGPCIADTIEEVRDDPSAS